jgi:hypothetical protein
MFYKIRFLAIAVPLILNLNPVVFLSANATQQDRFVFSQLRYAGAWDPYPETWQDIIEFLATTTSIKPEPARRVIELSDPALFSSPFLVVLGTAGFPPISEEGRRTLRRYLSNGGLMFVEDSTGIRNSTFDASFRAEIAKLFPETALKKLPPSHPLYRSYYLARKVGGRRLCNGFLEGVDVGGRTALIYSQNDLVGAWAKDRFGNYLWECAPGGQEQRFEAQKLTLNLIMYSVTGTYKSDAIHKPYIDMKLK